MLGVHGAVIGRRDTWVRQSGVEVQTQHVTFDTSQHELEGEAPAPKWTQARHEIPAKAS